MNAIMCKMAECVQCHKATLTLLQAPVVICHDCLHDKQPSFTAQRYPLPPPPRWRTWPFFALALVTYVWVLSIPLADGPLFWAVSLTLNSIVMIRASQRIRRRAVRHRAELKSLRDERVRQHIGGMECRKANT